MRCGALGGCVGDVVVRVREGGAGDVDVVPGLLYKYEPTFKGPLQRREVRWILTRFLGMTLRSRTLVLKKILYIWAVIPGESTQMLRPFSLDFNQNQLFLNTTLIVDGSNKDISLHHEEYFKV